MPIGVDDTWWDDGFVARVMVGCRDLGRIAGCFGEVATWWPRKIEIDPKEWWLRYPRAEQEDAERRIVAYIGREPGLDWATVDVGRSAADSNDGDYHRPLYEDAVAAMSLCPAAGPEFLESPVRVAVRLSAELNSTAVAFWGSDEEPALGGVCLVDAGGIRWSASICCSEAIERAAAAYFARDEDDSWDEDPDDDDSDGYDRFWLYRPGHPERCVEQGLKSWTSGQLKAIGCGVDWGVNPRDTHPYDFPMPMSEFTDAFVIAIRSR